MIALHRDGLDLSDEEECVQGTAQGVYISIRIAN